MEHGEVVFHLNVVDERDQLARLFIIEASAREVLERDVASEGIRRNRYFVGRHVDELLNDEDSTVLWETPSLESESAICHSGSGVVSESQGVDVSCLFL